MARSKSIFDLQSPMVPSGDQPQAIKRIVDNIKKGNRHQVLLGVTGSGKTFTMANVIKETNKPTLILAPNKTLAAQLYAEFKSLFPNNAVEYFVSFYDYYQPEAFVPSTNTFIEKDSAINEQIDRMRHSATRSLFDRKDVIIISSVSCIYGLGSPEAYKEMQVYLAPGEHYKKARLMRDLARMSYQKAAKKINRGEYRSVDDHTVEIFPPYEEGRLMRIEFYEDVVASIYLTDLEGNKLKQLKRTTIFPGSHYVTTEKSQKAAMKSISEELQSQIQFFKDKKMFEEAERIEQRVSRDLAALEEFGYFPGIENYSRHLTGRAEGEAPPTLLEYFPKDYLCLVDESHVMIPQIGGMYRGDRARKMNLVNFGFRLPSALDNRPLNFQEFETSVDTVLYVSATPGDYEMKKSEGRVVQQIIRPTGLLDPIIEVRSAKNQIKDILKEIRPRILNNERVLITTLTKKMSEDLTTYLQSKGIRVKYLHSDIKTIERTEIIRDLRLGEFDVLVGINLLREGLDIPEVTLVAITDADKEGFLRSERSLVQTIGRAARNDQGRVLLFADKITPSMEKAMQETSRRRAIQSGHNTLHGITPRTVSKQVRESVLNVYDPSLIKDKDEIVVKPQKVMVLKGSKKQLEEQLQSAVKNLEFEKAASIRNYLNNLE